MKYHFYIIFLFLTTTSLLSIGQNVTYHILDYNDQPFVVKWNVSKEEAINNGWFVEEKGDSLGRVIQLLFFYKNINKRACVDDPDYIVFSYPNDTTITVKELFAENLDNETVQMCCSFLNTQYVIIKQNDNILIKESLYVDTSRYFSFLLNTMVDSAEADKVLHRALDTLFEYGNYSLKYYCEYRNDECIPYYSYSFFKNGIARKQEH